MKLVLKLVFLRSSFYSIHPLFISNCRVCLRSIVSCLQVEDEVRICEERKGQFNHHFMTTFSANRFMLIFLVYSINVELLGVCISRVMHSFDGETDWHLLCQTLWTTAIMLCSKGLVKLTEERRLNSLFLEGRVETLQLKF